jgi:hypothetical protein
VGETPLWLYVLRESAVQLDGERLGAVAGRIVGAVLVGIISSDPEFNLSLRPPVTLPRLGRAPTLARALIVPLLSPVLAGCGAFTHHTSGPEKPVRIRLEQHRDF